MFVRNYLERIDADECVKKLLALEELTQGTKDYIGKIHNKRYEVLNKLDNGSYCQVYQVKDQIDEKIMFDESLCFYYLIKLIKIIFF
jgi:hypothetical protein